MQDDPFPAAEKILSDIEAVFQKDPELKEFDILPVTLNQNKSPVHHVENCLGLELWCVRHVYSYVYRRLFDMRQQKCRRIDPVIQSRLLLGALLLNPEVQTFWNMRRELLQAGRLDGNSELHLTAVVLSRKPKCAEAFSYRKWIVAKLKSGGEKTSCLLAEELRVAQAAANRYSNNYHAWQHRIWSLLQLAPAAECPQTYLEEWAASQAWAKMNVSDHSGWQYRQFLLTQLCDPAGDSLPDPDSVDRTLYQFVLPAVGKKEPFVPTARENCLPFLHNCRNSKVIKSLGFVIIELGLNTELITRYTGHEALWYHRRFLLTVMKSIVDHKKSGCLKVKAGEGVEVCIRDNGDGMVGTERGDGDAWSGVEAATADGVGELLVMVARAVPHHEAQLLPASAEADANQERLATQHNKWLHQVLRLDAGE